MTGVEPLLQDTGRGFTILYRGKNLYSPADPQGAARRRAAAARLLVRSLVLVPGLGLGYGLQELLSALPEHSRLLAVEVDPRLAALAARVPFPADPRLTVLPDADPARAAAAVRALGPHHFRRVQVVVLCGSYGLARAAFAALRDAVDGEIRRFWQNPLTLSALSRLWLSNLFTNLAWLAGEGGAEAAPEPAGEAAGPPRAILVAGAGPSLEQSLPWIRQVRRRGTLLAVDTALPVLADAGLPPDWVYALEAQVLNLEDFLPHRDPEITLLADLTSCPAVLRLFPRRRLFVTRFHPLALFDRLEAAGLLPPAMPPLGSVGVAAVQAALSLSSGPVLVAGLDFSYPAGRTHARGAPSHRRALTGCHRLLPPGMGAFEALLARPRLRLAGKGGRQVLSDLVLHSYAQLLAGLARSSGRVYDLGPEGLETGAVPVRSPAEMEAVLAGGPWPPAASPAPFRPRWGQVRDFFRNELRLLREAERALLGALDGAAAGVDLEALGYVELSVPAADPERLAARGNRALELLHTRWYIRLLERLAAPGDFRLH